MQSQLAEAPGPTTHDRVWMDDKKIAKACSSGLSTVCEHGTPWRFVAAHLFGRDRSVQTELTDLYEFGVFSGLSMMHLRRGSKVVGVDSKIGSVWALDSFKGLQEGVNRRGDDEKAWTAGAFSSSALYGIQSMSALHDKLRQIITEQGTNEGAQRDWFGKKITFVPGYYNESLYPGLGRTLGMRPALYVDVDVDQYLPTKQLLNFMFAEELVRPGSYIGYDDIGSTARWTAGESRAHLEIAREHGVRFQLVWNQCKNLTRGHPHWAWRQAGDQVHDKLCPEIAHCRSYYQLIFKVLAVGGKGAKWAVC